MTKLGYNGGVEFINAAVLMGFWCLVGLIAFSLVVILPLTVIADWISRRGERS